MGPNVHFESTSRFTRVPTLRAVEKLFSRVTQHVSLQMKRCCEGVSALFATERFFSGMNQHVALEMRSLIGGVIALCASKRLLTTVNQHMAFQMAGLTACVVALVAFVVLLSISLGPLGLFCTNVRLHFLVFPAKDFLSGVMKG